MKIDWYSEFVKPNYRPRRDEIVALYWYKPANNISPQEAVGRIASESSVGTWTTLPGMPVRRIKKLMAKVYKFNKSYAYVAYPADLWEAGSIPQLMSGIGGNIYGMKALNGLRLIDFRLPEKLLKKFKGPQYGRDVIQKIFKRKRGPVTATVIKPKLGYTAKEHAQLGYEIWVGGIDCVKDDENLTNQSFNKFEQRVKYLAKYRDLAEKETGDIKEAFINVTAPNVKELEKRIKTVHEYGFRYFMIDVVLTGFTALAHAIELARDLKMAIHGHRAMHAMFTRGDFGMTMWAYAKMMRLLGVDQLHIGTVVGKMAGGKEEVLTTRDVITRIKVKAKENTLLEQDWKTIKPILPVASGGLHPGILPELFDAYETTDIAIQVGGGVLGHPKGPQAGAKAVREAIEAYLEGIPLEEYAKSHKALREALKKWAHVKPV